MKKLSDLWLDYVIFTFDDPPMGSPPVKKAKECECGADKHGFANHSDWCPKYEEEK